MAGELGYQLGKLLVFLGIVMAVLGFVLMMGFKFPTLDFGRLPGDILHKGKNGTFYFPIVTCLVLSVALTLVLWLVSLITRR